jgi:stearoyl-CoA desaturase (Delta-9 desaturase)
MGLRPARARIEGRSLICYRALRQIRGLGRAQFRPLPGSARSAARTATLYRLTEKIVPEVNHRRVKWLNVLFLMGTLLVAAVATPWYLVTHGLGWPESLTFLCLWLAVGLSVTGGYHRLFAHRTYQAAWPVRLLYLVFGAAALENSVLNWTADHRVHHSNVDHERDPYNIQKGFWWAHMGWIFFEGDPPGHSVVRDLLEDPLVVWQDRWYGLLGLGVSFGIPLIVGLATGRVLGCLLIGGVLRVVVSHHGTFFINSLCHMVGRQPYSREHSARDSAVMAVLAFGEGYHNYHHSFPFDYRNGIKSWHFDPAKWTIWGLSAVGLAGNLRRASDAVVLKARIDVQFERAKEKLERVVAEARESADKHLHETHARLQAALQELVALQRQRSRRATPATPATAMDSVTAPSVALAPLAPTSLPAADVPESRMAAIHHALEQALRDWKLALREMKRLPRASRVATA